MNRQIKAITEIHHFFAELDIPSVIIGGMASQHWGEARFTEDVDVTILIPVGKEVTMCNRAFEKFGSRILDKPELQKVFETILYG